MGAEPQWLPDAARQVRFHQLLAAARKLWLMDALSETLRTADPARLKEELARFVPADAQQILAGAGIRDEHVFPTPVVLETAPQLVGYYRLLLGIPKKTFYAGNTGMGKFQSMEERGLLTDRQRQGLDQLCYQMGTALADLVRQLSPPISPQDVHELPLLTLGSQFQGGNNNVIGQRATAEVFLVITEALKPFTLDRTERSITVLARDQRRLVIALASDPDVSINEVTERANRHLVAIEIKGGTDRSNAHNRAGEAEKSHLKAKQSGYEQFWTVISTTGLDMGVLRGESPATSEWFDAGEVLGQQGDAWRRFRTRLFQVLGIV